MIKDLNYIDKLEKALEKKYGKIAITNPMADWNEEKEENYKAELKKFVNKIQELKAKKKIIKRNHFRACKNCGKQTLMIEDDITITKTGYCHFCHIKEGNHGQ